MPAAAATIDFEGLPTQTSITNQISGVTISASSGIGEAWVYNTASDTADPDLASPFSEIGGGPDLSPGNILIVQENPLPGPPDDNGGGGTLSFSFSTSVQMVSIDVFDMELGSNIQLFSDAAFTNQIGSNFVLGKSDTGDNQFPNLYEHVVFGNVSGVQSMRVNMAGSGGVDNISTVPLPAAVWLFGSSLLGLVCVARRKRGQLAA